MPVIINDFQIEVEPPSQPTQARGGGDSDSGQTPAPSPKMKPEEITSVVRLNRERVERVHAD